MLEGFQRVAHAEIEYSKRRQNVRVLWGKLQRLLVDVDRTFIILSQNVNLRWEIIFTVATSIIRFMPSSARACPAHAIRRRGGFTDVTFGDGTGPQPGNSTGG